MPEYEFQVTIDPGKSTEEYLDDLLNALKRSLRLPPSEEKAQGLMAAGVAARFLATRVPDRQRILDLFSNLRREKEWDSSVLAIAEKTFNRACKEATEFAKTKLLRRQK